MITSALSIGDTVTIRDDKSDTECQKLQEKVGKWDQDTKKMLLDCCEVMQIEGERIQVRGRDGVMCDVNIHILKIIRLASFREDEMVQMITDEAQARQLQVGHGGWHDIMQIMLGQDLKVVQIISGDIRKVRYLGMEFNVNVACLVQRSRFAVNREVRLIKSEQMVRKLQEGHGGWYESMKPFLGKKGMIVEICPSNDILVTFGISFFVFNPECLESDIDIGHSNRIMSFIGEIRKANMEMVEKLVDRKIINEPCPCTGLSAVMIAIEVGQSDLVDLLLDRGASVDAQYLDGNTVLHYIVLNDKPQYLARLIQHNSRINQQNYEGLTPLMMTAIKDNNHLFSELVTQPDIDLLLEDNKGNTVLHHAILHSNNQMISSLINRGVSLLKENNDCFSAFHLAVVRRNIEVLELMLQQRHEKDASPVNVQKSNDKYSGLHLAAFHSYSDVISILLDNGADANLRNAEGETALHIAVLKSRACVEYLCGAMTDMDVMDKAGNSPLHKVVKKVPEEQLDNVRDIVDCLLRHGATPATRNATGLSAIELCEHTFISTMMINQDDTQTGDRSQSHTEQQQEQPPSIQMLRSKISAITDQNLCQICLDGDRSLVFNCGHNCCPECGSRLIQCHICRQVISQRIKIMK